MRMEAYLRSSAEIKIETVPIGDLDYTRHELPTPGTAIDWRTLLGLSKDAAISANSNGQANQRELFHFGYNTMDGCIRHDVITT